MRFVFFFPWCGSVGVCVWTSEVLLVTLTATCCYFCWCFRRPLPSRRRWWYCWSPHAGTHASTNITRFLDDVSKWISITFLSYVCVYGVSRNSSGIAVCMSMYHIANDHTASLSFRDSKPKSMATARARATMYYANILFVCPWRACVYVCVHGVRVWESDAAFCGSK